MHEVTESIEAKITFFPSLLKAKSAIVNDLVELLNEGQSKLVEHQTDSYPTLLKQSIQMLKTYFTNNSLGYPSLVASQ